MRWVWVFVVVSAAVSCASTERFETLPLAEIRTFEECRAMGTLSRCSAEREARHTACWNRQREYFAAKETADRRAMWLINLGCPPRVVAEGYD